jgi:hypothetical protein
VDSLKALDPEWPIREAAVNADIFVRLVRANRRHSTDKMRWREGAR